MKSAAISLFIASACLAITVTAVERCQCDQPVGGGVQCEIDQSAGCNPETGRCQCTCTTVIKGKPGRDNLAAILTNTLRRKVEPAKISKPLLAQGREPADFSIVFDETGVRLKTAITIGVPQWLVPDLQPFVLRAVPTVAQK